MARILVTDGQWRKSLAAVRSLGRSGHRVAVTGDRRLTTSFFSRYCDERHIFPMAEQDTGACWDSLRALARSGQYDLIVPMEDDTVRLCARHREELATHLAVPLPDHEILMRAADKAQTAELAQRCGVAQPRFRLLAEPSDLESPQPDASGPWIVKPRVSSGSRGQRRVPAGGDLVGAVREVHRSFPYPVVQELLPSGGETRGVSVLMDAEGEVWASFVHERIREYPIDGGPSTLRVSVHDPVLVDRAVRLLREMEWSGMAMVEFKRDPRDGEFKLLEVNPRFVGSLQLAVLAGVDFPTLLYDAFSGAPRPEPPSYREGVMCRWLLPGDLLHFFANPKRWSLEPSFFRFRGPDLGYDICSRDDPGPIAGRVLAMIALTFDSRARGLVFNR